MDAILIILFGLVLVFSRKVSVKFFALVGLALVILEILPI